LEETLEQFPAIACTNSLPFDLDMIYCCHFIPFSVANILLDRSLKYQLLFADFYVKNFCVKTGFFFTFCVVLQHFQQAFACFFFAGSYQKEGETLPKSPTRLPQEPFLVG
jgi:hypothetical protein